MAGTVVVVVVVETAETGSIEAVAEKPAGLHSFAHTLVLKKYFVKKSFVTSMFKMPSRMSLF